MDDINFEYALKDVYLCCLDAEGDYEWLADDLCLVLCKILGNEGFDAWIAAISE